MPRKSNQIYEKDHNQNFLSSLFCHPDFLADDYVVEPISYADGLMHVPTGPGIGADVDPDKVREYHDHFEQEGMASIYPTTNDAPPLFVPSY